MCSAVLGGTIYPNHDMCYLDSCLLGAIMVEEEPNDPVEDAISECDLYIRNQQNDARKLLSIIAMFVGFAFVSISFLMIYTRMIPATSNSSSSDSVNSSVSDITLILIAIMSAFTVIFGILIALYRYHLNEISKTEHYKIGFMRIRIAAESKRKGYQQTEVLESLTHMALTAPDRKSFAGKQSVESPLPGHPLSDVGTTLLNRILDSVEIKISEKKGNTDKSKDD